MRFAAAAGLLLALLLPAASGATPPSYEAFGSCATAKPFTAAERCDFDRPDHAEGTIVFRSRVGKRMLEVCQKIYGLSFEGRQCLKTEKPTAFEAIPFELNGAEASFRLVVTISARKPGSDGPFERAARVALGFDRD